MAENPMADIYPSRKRSEIMSHIRAAGTKPELIVRKVAHNLGYRFRLHQKNLPGKPDIVFAQHRKIILVHGCFWHSHKICGKAKRPVTNKTFWNRKLSRNVERDKENVDALGKAGWELLVIWECETKDRYLLADKISSFMGKSQNRRMIK
jgi:DNA mismatch endonuclease (patch repair protein)